MFCRKCGTELSDDMSFCPKCGNSILMLENHINADKALVEENAKREKESVRKDDKTKKRNSNNNYKIILYILCSAIIIAALIVGILLVNKSNNKSSGGELLDKEDNMNINETDSEQFDTNTNEISDDVLPEFADRHGFSVYFITKYNGKYLVIEEQKMDIYLDELYLSVGGTKNAHRAFIDSDYASVEEKNALLTDQNSIELKNAYVDYYNEYFASIQPKIDEFFLYVSDDFSKNKDLNNYHETPFIDNLPKQTVLRIKDKVFHINYDYAKIKSFTFSDYDDDPSVPSIENGSKRRVLTGIAIVCDAAMPEDECQALKKMIEELYEEDCSNDLDWTYDTDNFDKNIDYITTLTPQAKYPIDEYEEYLKVERGYDLGHKEWAQAEMKKKLNEANEDEVNEGEVNEDNEQVIDGSELIGTYYDPTTFSVIKFTFDGDGTGKIDWGSKSDSMTYALEGNQVIVYLKNTTYPLSYDGTNLYDDSGSTYVKKVD